MRILAVAALLFVARTPLPQVVPETIAVVTTPLSIDPADPSRERIGSLRWMGGLVLTAPDARLGGLSSLRFDGRALLAASDEGDVFAMIPREVGGVLIGLAQVRVRRLNGADGRPLPHDKALADIESLELSGNSAIVSVESDSTIWRYRLVRGLPVGTPAQLRDGAAWRERQSRTNGGIEAHAIGRGIRLMVSEESREPDGAASAYVIADGREQRLGIPLGGVFAPTDLVLLDARSRSFLLLQRDYRKGIGTWTRLARFALQRVDGRWRAGPVTTLAEFGPPLTADNMEGLALRREGGRTFVYMVSDDNFSKAQRTLLMKWEVVG